MKARQNRACSCFIKNFIFATSGRQNPPFKILIDLHDELTCNITQQMKMAELVRKADMIIWDEAPMMHCRTFKTIDRTLHDLM
jgi:hypothetical protein